MGALQGFNDTQRSSATPGAVFTTLILSVTYECAQYDVLIVLHTGKGQTL
jgi:hypothetical protein